MALRFGKYLPKLIFTESKRLLMTTMAAFINLPTCGRGK